MMRKLAMLLTFLWTIVGASYGQDNQELQEMADKDQESRFSGNIDWNMLNYEDSVRRARVKEMVEAGMLVTGKDFFNAGIIYQHGNDSIASGMAVRFFEKAISMDSTLNKWWYAAAVDRDLMRRGKPQIYGTQFVQDNSTFGKLRRYSIDTTQVTDQDRQYYGVETLAEQREKERIMNLKSFGAFYFESNSIQQTVDLIKTEFEKGTNSGFNISEAAINSFGYQLIGQQKLDEALLVLELNTRLYPESANTFDSLGEILRLNGKVQESIAAYKRSVELNPANEHGKNMIREMEGSGIGN